MFKRSGSVSSALLFHPGRGTDVGRLVVDGELAHRGLQGLLVAREIGGDGVVKEQKLLVHHFHLTGGKKRRIKCREKNDFPRNFCVYKISISRARPAVCMSCDGL